MPEKGFKRKLETVKTQKNTNRTKKNSIRKMKSLKNIGKKKLKKSEFQKNTEKRNHDSLQPSQKRIGEIVRNFPKYE